MMRARLVSSVSSTGFAPAMPALFTSKSTGAEALHRLRHDIVGNGGTGEIAYDLQNVVVVEGGVVRHWRAIDCGQSPAIRQKAQRRRPPDATRWAAPVTMATRLRPVGTAIVCLPPWCSYCCIGAERSTGRTGLKRRHHNVCSCCYAPGYPALGLTELRPKKNESVGSRACRYWLCRGGSRGRASRAATILLRVNFGDRILMKSISILRR